MNRREIMVMLGSAAALSVAARAQAMPVIGFLHGQTPDAYSKMVAAFHQGLSETGYIEGRNVTVEYRWGNNQADRLPELAADLVRRRVDVIAAVGGGPPTLAAKAATSTIPIVFVSGGDPVRSGIVASLNRPGSNITGVSFLANELGPKRLEILCELVPQAMTIAHLSDPRTPGSEEANKSLLAAASSLGRRVISLEVRTERDFDAAFGTIAQRQVGALIVGTSALFNSRRDELVGMAARYKIPAAYAYRDFTESGGLVSYGASLTDAYRQGGVYVAKILNGTKPADLPVMQPTKFETILNLKTARALDLVVSQSLLAIADEVIE